jgi:phospholipase/carboxylesterase
VVGRRLGGTAVLLVHGRDDRVLPFSLGEQSREILAASGLPLTWRPHDGGHTITPAMRDDIDAWLREQLGPPSP